MPPPNHGLSWNRHSHMLTRVCAHTHTHTHLQLLQLSGHRKLEEGRGTCSDKGNPAFGQWDSVAVWDL